MVVAQIYGRLNITWMVTCSTDPASSWPRGSWPTYCFVVDCIVDFVHLLLIINNNRQRGSNTCTCIMKQNRTVHCNGKMYFCAFMYSMCVCTVYHCTRTCMCLHFIHNISFTKHVPVDSTYTVHVHAVFTLYTIVHVNLH